MHISKTFDNYISNTMSSVKVAMITNIPPPYREVMHTMLNKELNNNYHVFFCAKIESHRLWNVKGGDYNKTFLKKSILSFFKETIYLNLDILKEMKRFNPDIVITDGYNPTMLLAFMWSVLRGRKHIVFTDGTIDSERFLSLSHKLVRKIVFRFSLAFIGASNKSLEIFLNYNISREKLFLSPLCVDNVYYNQGIEVTKQYDMIFSGQFIDRKMPFFFIDVAKLVNESYPCKVILIGSGELREEMLNRLEELKISYSCPGFIQQEQLPFVYGAAKLMLFPTKTDAWGVVANEACASGLPVITCNNAGAANELIIHNYNGFVLPLDEDLWAKYTIKVLTDVTLYKKLSENAIEGVKAYNYDAAVKGILSAIDFV